MGYPVPAGEIKSYQGERRDDHADAPSKHRTRIEAKNTFAGLTRARRPLSKSAMLPGARWAPALDGLSAAAPAGDPDYLAPHSSLALSLGGDHPALPARFVPRAQFGHAGPQATHPPEAIPKAAAARLAAVLAKLELNMNPTAVALEPGMTLGPMGHSLRDLV